jgi:hypothetical protein
MCRLRSSTCDALYCAAVSRNGIISILRLWQISGRNLSYRCAKGKRVARPYDSNFRSSARVNTLPANHIYPPKTVVVCEGFTFHADSFHQTFPPKSVATFETKKSPLFVEHLIRFKWCRRGYSNAHGFPITPQGTVVCTRFAVGTVSPHKIFPTFRTVSKRGQVSDGISQDQRLGRSYSAMRSIRRL